MLDARTLLFTIGAGFFVLAFMGFYMAFLHREERALRFWAPGCLVIGTANMLLYFRPVLPEFLSILVGNSAIIAGGWLMYAGIATFDRQPTRLLFGAALTLVTAGLLAYWTYVAPNFYARMILVTSAMIPVFILMMLSMLRPDMPEHRLLRRVMGLMFAYLILLSLVRIGYAAWNPDPTKANLFSNEPLQAFWLLSTLVIVFLNSLDFLLMPGQRMQTQLDKLARIDELTGLLNRRAFDRRMNEYAGSERGAAPDACVMALDLDHFKQLNDRHGHAAGDAVLRDFAATVTSQLRREDVFARYGGEEFSVMLPGTGIADAALAAERVRDAVERMDVRFGDTVLKITVSIGVAPLSAQGFEASLAQADTALYRAKSLGRNRVEVSADATAPQVQTVSRSSA